jgi:hypothetical protein
MTTRHIHLPFNATFLDLFHPDFYRGVFLRVTSEDGGILPRFVDGFEIKGFNFESVKHFGSHIEKTEGV